MDERSHLSACHIQARAEERSLCVAANCDASKGDGVDVGLVDAGDVIKHITGDLEQIQRIRQE